MYEWRVLRKQLHDAWKDALNAKQFKTILKKIEAHLQNVIKALPISKRNG
jgi:hypothetical protein